jgi:hypothetical protein
VTKDDCTKQVDEVVPSCEDQHLNAQFSLRLTIVRRIAVMPERRANL